MQREVCIRNASAVVLALLLGLIQAAMRPQPASAQITITEADLMPALGDTVTTFVFSAQDPENATTIVDATGENATYDFTALTYDASTIGYALWQVNASSTPGTEFSVLADAEYVSESLTEPGGYSYYSIDDEGAHLHGLVFFFDADFDGVDDQVVLYNDPPLLEYVLPLDRHSAWESTTIQTSVADVSTGGQVSVEQAYTRQAEVEGWGTLVTPEHTAPALRLRSQITVTLEGVTTPMTLIEFRTKVGLTAVIWLDAAGQLTTVTYTYTEGVGGGTEENQPPMAVATTNIEDGASIVLGGADGEAPGDPEAPFVVEWTAASDPDGDPLTYRWQLATCTAFDAGTGKANALLIDAPSADGGTATRFETDLGTLAALLSDQGVVLGEALTLYHRVVASDGVNVVPSDPFSITFVRGTLVGTEDEPGLPARFVLHGNYPNPFTSSTRIVFALPKSGRTTLRVYDMLGREVATLLDGELPAGHHTIDFRAEDLASGVYFCRLEGHGLASVHRLIVQQ